MTQLPKATARLRYALPQAAHIPAFTAFLTGPRAEALGWAGRPHEAWRHFAAVIGHHALRGFGPFVAETPAGRPVGLFGPWHPGGQDKAEIKWILWDGADEGRGLAHEAAEAMLGHAFGQLGWNQAVSYIQPSNTRSSALAARLGAVKEAEWTTPSGKLVDVWRHSDSWRAAA